MSDSRRWKSSLQDGTSSLSFAETWETGMIWDQLPAFQQQANKRSTTPAQGLSPPMHLIRATSLAPPSKIYEVESKFPIAPGDGPLTNHNPIGASPTLPASSTRKRPEFRMSPMLKSIDRADSVGADEYDLMKETGVNVTFSDTTHRNTRHMLTNNAVLYYHKLDALADIPGWSYVDGHFKKYRPDAIRVRVTMPGLRTDIKQRKPLPVTMDSHEYTTSYAVQDSANVRHSNRGSRSFGRTLPGMRGIYDAEVSWQVRRVKRPAPSTDTTDITHDVEGWDSLTAKMTANPSDTVQFQVISTAGTHNTDLVAAISDNKKFVNGTYLYEWNLNRNRGSMGQLGNEPVAEDLLEAKFIPRVRPKVGMMYGENCATRQELDTNIRFPWMFQTHVPGLMLDFETLAAKRFLRLTKYRGFIERVFPVLIPLQEASGSGSGVGSIGGLVLPRFQKSPWIYSKRERAATIMDFTKAGLDVDPEQVALAQPYLLFSDLPMGDAGTFTYGSNRPDNRTTFHGHTIMKPCIRPMHITYEFKWSVSDPAPYDEDKWGVRNAFVGGSEGALGLGLFDQQNLSSSGVVNTHIPGDIDNDLLPEFGGTAMREDEPDQAT